MIFIIFLVFIYSIGFYCDTTQLGIYNGCEWWNYITYSFVHTNFFSSKYQFCIILVLLEKAPELQPVYHYANNGYNSYSLSNLCNLSGTDSWCLSNSLIYGRHYYSRH